MAVIALDNVKVVRDSDLVLDVDHLEIADGELLVVLGPSGAGKSMLLRAIAGLEPIDTGTIRFDGIDMTNVKTAERGIAMVFQNHVLYPFLNVRENIAFPLKLRKTPAAEIDSRVEAEARVLAIEDLLAGPASWEPVIDNWSMPPACSFGRPWRSSWTNRWRCSIRSFGCRYGARFACSNRATASPLCSPRTTTTKR